MKKLILLFTLVLFTFNTYSQDKGYIGLGLGIAIPGGDISEGDTGIAMNLIGLGYMFSEKIGATVNWGSSGHTIEGGSFGAGYLGIGPLFRFPAGDNMTFDVKPQYSSSAMVVKVDGVGEVSNTGSGFILGTSLNLSKSKQWGWNVDLDYQSGKVGDLNYSVIAIRGGFQYRF